MPTQFFLFRRYLSEGGHNRMAESSPPPVTVGEDLYVKLGTSTPPTSQFMNVIRDSQQELPHLRSNNERFLKDREEQERMIRELTEKSSYIVNELEDQKEHMLRWSQRSLKSEVIPIRLIKITKGK